MTTHPTFVQRIRRLIHSTPQSQVPALPVGIPSGRPVTRSDIVSAYRLVLGRNPDPQGLAQYLVRAERGLSLAAFLAELLASDEYRNRPSSASNEPGATGPVGASPADPSLIRPEVMIATCSVDELISTSEEYYRRVTDPAPLMAKPFAYWHETPQMLQDLGLLLSGMHIGKSMTVLDFGAGTCWLSRILAQLNCQPICCDVSVTALAIGERLFRELPVLGTAAVEPVFLPFDGARINLEDASVDRIVCFDAFHHVPNPETVLLEFGRVLRPGGVLGMSEPGRQHSRSPQSQYEMKHHRVLENDIDLLQIFDWSTRAGFTEMRVKAIADDELSLDEYASLLDGNAGGSEDVRARLVDHLADSTTSRSIFFLFKGPLAQDSRRHVGLAHEISYDSDRDVTIQTGESLTLDFQIKNTGSARWLGTNREIFGVVRLASHLFGDDGRLLELDCSRHDLPADVGPGESVRMSVDLPPFIEPGRFRLAFDLVAEGVTWFENVGSMPIDVRVEVRECR